MTVSRPLRVAVPKGRLLHNTLDALVETGVLAAMPKDAGRRLVIDLPAEDTIFSTPVQLLLLKNADVPTWVDHGVADLGVCGTDVLDESGARVFRPWTFPFGRCRISIAGSPETSLEELRARELTRVATKYVAVTRRWFAERDWNVEVIALGGSVELAAVLGLSDVIVDLVETGNTLRANGLVELLEIGETRVKLIANRALDAPRAAALELLLQRFALLPPAPEGAP